MTRKRGRPKNRKRKINVNLSIDADLYKKARRDIDNISAYVTQCLKRHLSYINDLDINKKSTLSRKSSDRQSATLNDYYHDTRTEAECQDISDAEFDKLLESL